MSQAAPETLSVAVAQCPGELDGSNARLAWLERQLAHHDGRDFDLVVLPELFQCGYNVGDQVRDRAEPATGPFAAAIAELATRHDLAILYGFSQQRGDALFNCAQCIERNGEIIGQHQKLLLPPGFEGDHFAPGSSCAPFDLGGFRVAILVCYDAEFPENMRHAALAGADLVVVPTALGAQWSVVAEKVIPARAFENGIFVCYANYCGAENGLDYYGGSCIVGPDGKDIARAGRGAEIIGARLQKTAVENAQTRLPYLRDRARLPWMS